MIVRQLLFYFSALAIFCIALLSSLVINEHFVIDDYKRNFIKFFNQPSYAVVDSNDLVNGFKSYLKNSQRGGTLSLNKGSKELFSALKKPDTAYLSYKKIIYTKGNYTTILIIPLLKEQTIRQSIVILMGAALILVFISLVHYQISMRKAETTVRYPDYGIPDKPSEAAVYLLANEIRRSLSWEQELSYIFIKMETKAKKRKCMTLFQQSGISFEYLYNDISDTVFSVIVPDAGFEEIMLSLKRIRSKLTSGSGIRSIKAGFSSTQARIMNAEQLHLESRQALIKCIRDPNAFYYGFIVNALRYDEMLFRKG